VNKNERLKQFITSEKITQKEFALKIDSTQQYVSALLNGKRKLGSNILERIEKEFNINIAWLLTGEGAMKKGAVVEELQANEEQADYKLNDVQAMHQDLKKDLNSLAEGMIKNFEVISTGVMQGLMDQRKLLDWTEKIDPDKINKSSEKLEEFLKQNK